MDRLVLDLSVVRTCTVSALPRGPNEASPISFTRRVGCLLNLGEFGPGAVSSGLSPRPLRRRLTLFCCLGINASRVAWIRLRDCLASAASIKDYRRGMATAGVASIFLFLPLESFNWLWGVDFILNDPGLRLPLPCLEIESLPRFRDSLCKALQFDYEGGTPSAGAVTLILFSTKSELRLPHRGRACDSDLTGAPVCRFDVANL